MIVVLEQLYCLTVFVPKAVRFMTRSGLRQNQQSVHVNRNEYDYLISKFSECNVWCTMGMRVERHH